MNRREMIVQSLAMFGSGLGGLFCRGKETETVWMFEYPSTKTFFSNTVYLSGYIQRPPEARCTFSHCRFVRCVLDYEFMRGVYEGEITLAACTFEDCHTYDGLS